MPSPKTNTATTNSFSNVKARQIDFVSQFATQFTTLMNLLSVARPIKKESGAELRMIKAKVSLEDSVAEGVEIPYSEIEWEQVEADPIVLEKYSTGVTAEAINKYGYDTAVDKSDQEFLAEITGKVTDNLYGALDTEDALTGEATGLQKQLTTALAKLSTHFELMNKAVTGTVAWVNTTDFYDYLGEKDITVQTAFGLTYVQNYLGFDVIFLTAKVTSGTVKATVLNNLNVYYIDPADSDFAKAGLVYQTDETGYIGLHIDADYKTAVSESFAVSGAKLYPEYADGIAIITTPESDSDEEVTP